MKMQAPSGWTSKHAAAWAGIAAFGGFAVLCAVWAVVSLGNGEFPTAVTSGALAVMLGSFIVPALLVFTGTVTPRTTTGEDGFVIACDRVVDTASVWLSRSAIVAGCLFIFFAARNELSMGLSPGQRVFFPAAAAFVVVVATRGELGRRRRGPNRVDLTPYEIEFRDTVTGLTALSWDEIVAVLDETSEKKVAFPICLMDSAGRSHLFGEAGSFVPGGAALYWLIRFYWLNPGNREELVDGRAEKRLREGDFPLN